MANRDTTKITLTLGKDTVSWVEEEYPDALSEQEAIRMAISDARRLAPSQDTTDAE